MISTLSSPPRKPQRSLWQRAPLWRFCALCFALLALLSLLYPPLFTPNQPAQPPPLNWTSYTPPPLPVLPQTQAQEQVQPQTRAQPLRAVKAPPPAAMHAPPPIPPTPPVGVAHAAPSQAPGVAQLSLATPAGQPVADNSGIDPGLLGRTYHSYLQANGFKVPLPPGEWAMLANSTVKTLKDPNNTGMNYFLGQIENKRLVGAIQILALRSAASPGTGFVAFGCDNPNFIYSMKEDIQPFAHQSCWVVHNWFTPPWQEWADQSKKMPELMRAAAGDLAAKGVTYPQDLMDVQFYRSETWGLLEVSYLFSPEKEHIASNVAPTFRDSDWWGPNLRRSPEKLAYIESLKVWGASFWPRIKQAFDAGQTP